MVKAARGIAKEGRKNNKKHKVDKQQASAMGVAVAAAGGAGSQPEQVKKQKGDSASDPVAPAATILSISGEATEERGAAPEDGEEVWAEPGEGDTIGLLDDSLELVLPLIDNELFGESERKCRTAREGNKRLSGISKAIVSSACIDDAQQVTLCGVLKA